MILLHITHNKLPILRQKNGDDMKKKKGEYGYIPYRRKQVIIRTIIYFAISFVLFAAGYIVTGTNANILTIVAVLGMLPSSKSMVEAIMFIKARESSKDIVNIIASAASDRLIAYELFLTAYSKNFPLTAVTVSGNTVYAYSEHENCELDAASKHIKDILNQNQLTCDVQISRDLDSFLAILANWEDTDASLESDSLEQVSADSKATQNERKNPAEEILKIIMAISL